MSIKQVPIVLSLVYLQLCPFGGATYGSTDVWVSHVTSQAGWKTGLSVFYTGSEPTASFTLTRIDEAGQVLEDPAVSSASNNVWSSISDASLAYNGSARVRSESNLVVKVSYRYGESLSLCEFYLSGDADLEWVVPNAAYPWFNWTGIGLVNSSDAPAVVTLEAWKQGSRVAIHSMTLPARAHYAKTSHEIWDGLSVAQFDTAVVRTSVPIPPPICIAGNSAQDRHVFFEAQPRPQNDRSLYLINGTLIDGTGREPISNAVVGIRNGRIFLAGRSGEVQVPARRTFWM